MIRALHQARVNFHWITWNDIINLDGLTYFLLRDEIWAGEYEDSVNHVDYRLSQMDSFWTIRIVSRGTINL